MANNIIPRGDRRFAEVVARLTYCNHFLQERIDLEREALGDNYRETEQPWNLRPEEDSRDPNLKALLERIEQVAMRCRANIIKLGGCGGSELQLYRYLVYFLNFYRFRYDFDKMIEQSHAGGATVRKVSFVDQFREHLDNFFRPNGIAVELEYSYAHLLAFSYQLRRAYTHIFYYIIGTSPATRHLRARVWESIFTHDAARYQRALFHRMGDVITLICGPSGSGKELVARAIGLSRYIPFDEKTREFEEDFLCAFYPLNLSALSPTLIESELFGHRRGAFTGALQDRKGYFEECGPFGTVFLDEIGDTDISIQVKLLRVLQTRQFQRLGDTGTCRFEGKVMAATNRDLIAEIAAGRFREEFFYRLCADRIETPGLRTILADDPDEITYLVRHIAGQVAGEEEAESLTEEVCDWIVRNLGTGYAWAGNFRELEQCVRNILIHQQYLPPEIGKKAESNTVSQLIDEGRVPAEAVMREYVTRVFARSSTLQEAARTLGLDRRTVKKYIDEDLLREGDSAPQ